MAGPAMLGGVFGMDALWYQFVLGYHGNAIGYGVVAVLIPVVLGATLRLRLVGVGVAAVLAGVALGGLWVVSEVPVWLGSGR